MPDPALYTVGLITAITTEFAAACAMLDSEEEEGPDYVSPGDMNSYTLGTMGKHNVVIASLPHGDYGTSSAAAVVSNMLNSFPNIRVGLMVGIGGGAPTAKHDIRLGDIVVSARDGDTSTGGVFQYDFGKAIQDQEFKTTRLLSQPPPALLAALSNLRQFYDRKGGHTLESDVRAAFAGSSGIQGTHSRPEPTTDRLYKSDYVHNDTCCAGSRGDDDPNLVARVARKEGDGKSVIHYGVIASANQLMKDAKMRDKITEEHGVLCFEMEAAGLMNHFPCLVVRGICDYSDSHKNNQWQGYAAMMAAAYTKSLLKRIAPTRVEQERKLSEIVTSVDECVKAMHITTQDMHASINDASVEQRDARIHEWLSHPDLDPSVNYNKARQERIKDSTSGQWFLQNETFSKWKLRKNSSLWLYGITGCGKTVLVSTVLEHLERTYENVLYFYFDFAQERKQSVDGMIRSLISQLSRKSTPSRKHIDSFYQSHEEGEKQPDLRSLCETFQAMLKESGEVWIILDALDECKIRKDPGGHSGCGLLSWIPSLASSETDVHLIFTSRPEQDIRSALSNWMAEDDMFPIESRSMYGDIQDYVHTKVREHEGLKRWRHQPHVQREIENALLERANGMFRWVACQLDSLEECADLYTLRDALKALPTSLEETYARTLRNLPATTKHLTIRILQFLAYGQRPLTIEEAVDMVVVRADPEKEDSWFNEDYRLPIPEEIARYCSSLVSVTMHEIQLAHFSVKEYLVSNRLKPTICNGFQDIVARTCITEVCLAYLLALPSKWPVDSIMRWFPFAKFAALYWASHAAFVEDRSKSTLFFVKEFLSREVYKMWCEVHSTKYLSTDGSTRIPSPLKYAAMMGLPNSIQILLDGVADANEKDEQLSELLNTAAAEGHEKVALKLITLGAKVNEGDPSPLYQAVLKGHDTVVKLLLDYGADVNVDCLSMLTCASREGYKSIVQRLLEHGADPNATSQVSYAFEIRGMFRAAYTIGNTALCAASSRGHNEVVQILIHAGAKVNALITGHKISTGSDSPSKIHMSALSEACRQGREEVVKTLIKFGAHKDSSSSSALVSAASAGRNNIVRALLDSGVNVDSRTAFAAGISEMQEYEFNALQVAAYHGNENLVRLLLSRGAKVNSLLGNLYWNALRAAQWLGRTKIMQLLINAGADANNNGGRRPLPLQAAASVSNEKVMKILLQGGADVAAQGSEALYTATDQGCESLVRLLISAGADVNKEAGEYGSALVMASRKGSGKIFRAFVETGALKNAVDSVKFTALCWASETGSKYISTALLDNKAPTDLQGEHLYPLYLASTNGHSKIVELLLQRGADINAYSQSNGPALEGAARSGREDIVKTLLQRGADVNANSGLSLYSAASHGHESIVRILLKHSADVNLINDTAHTPLAGACESGNVNIVEVLLRNGADPSIVNQHGQTTFSAACVGGSVEICKMLLTQGASIDDIETEALYYASKEGYHLIVQLLLELGCDVDLEYEGHGRPLLAACIEGHITVVSILLRYGAKVYGIFDQPIIYAAMNGDREMVQMLRAAYRKCKHENIGRRDE